jgi:hypothetical protein
MTEGQRGAVPVEVGLCLAVLAVLSLGITDVARGYVLSQRVHSAAEGAALYAASHPGQLHNVPGTPCADPGNATWQGLNAANGSVRLSFSPDLAEPTGDCNPPWLPVGLAAGKLLRVTAAARLTLATPLLGAVVGKMQVSTTLCVDVTGPPSTVPCPGARAG